MFLTMVSGGEALNFGVKTYATEKEMLASTPPENTIGVEAESIEGYAISAGEPENPTVGMLWVQIHGDSPVKFPVTKQNTVFLHPLKAFIYRYVQGNADPVWDSVVSYLYMNSKWNVFGRLYFIRNVELNESVCRNDTVICGYSGATWCDYTRTKKSAGFEYNVTHDEYGSSAATGAGIFLANEKLTPVKVDLTPYKNLTFTGMFEDDNDNSNVYYGCWKELPTGGYKDGTAAVVKRTTYSTEPAVVDVSALEGEHYIGFGIRSARVRIDECYLEM